MFRLPPPSAPARLLLAAGVFLVGEATGFALPRLADAWAGVAGILATILLAAYGWRVRHLGWGVLLGAGLLLAFRTDVRRMEVLVAPTNGSAPRVLRVEGPVTLRTGRNGGRHAEFPSSAAPLPLRVVLPVPDGEPPPQAGERWEVRGRIAHGPDGRSRFARHTLFVRSPAHARRLPAAAGDVARRNWHRLGEGLARTLGLGLGWCGELAGLNRAILLGRREEIDPARRRTFVDAGTIHVFAISGLHVMVLAWFLDALLLRLDLPHGLRGLVSLPPLWAYVVLTGAHPSAVRAALMASLCLAATAFGRRPDARCAWALTAFLVYGLHPERLFDVGCAFSFAVMLGIVLWLDLTDRTELHVLDGHPGLRRHAGDFAFSFAAWAAGVPIAAHVFGRVTPGGLLANFVVIKCAKPLVQLAAGALAAGGFCAPLAALLNNAAAVFTWAMVVVSERVAALPGSTFEVRPWSLAACAAWYAGYGAVLLLLGRILPGWGRVAKRWWK